MSDKESRLKTPQQNIGVNFDHEEVEKSRLTGSDIGTAVLDGIPHGIDLDGPEAKRVLRKIDMWLLPMLCITYMVQFLDKSSVSMSALWGMRQDAHLVGDQYSWLTTIFYIGYLVAEFPVNIVFQRFDIAKSCGLFIILWGVVLICMAAGSNFTSLVTARFFLGALEAGVSPCFVLMTAMFYTRQEQPFRTGIWFSMNGISNIIGGLVGYGVGFIETSVAAWKFPFLIFGAITIVWGVVFLYLAPSNPTTAKWLTSKEKSIAVLRLAENKTGIDNKEFKWDQVYEALRDPIFWLLNIQTIANCIPNGAVGAFGPLIINGFGYDSFQSTLLSMPVGVTQVMALLISGWLASNIKGIRHFVMVGGVLVSILAVALIYALPDEQRIGRLIGYYLIIGFSPTFVQGLNLIQANVAGRTKKTIFSSSVFISYCVGNLVGPQLMFEREAPRYSSGFAAMLVCFGAQVLFISAMYVVNRLENNRRDRLAAESGDFGPVDIIADGLSDKTDKQNPHFRYLL